MMGVAFILLQLFTYAHIDTVTELYLTHGALYNAIILANYTKDHKVVRSDTVGNYGLFDQQLAVMAAAIGKPIEGKPEGWQARKYLKDIKSRITTAIKELLSNGNISTDGILTEYRTDGSVYVWDFRSCKNWGACQEVLKRVFTDRPESFLITCKWTVPDPKPSTVGRTRVGQ
jgi:hypothetical protein